MKRRTFIKGTVAAAITVAIPGGDGVMLNSIPHPTLEEFAIANRPVEMGARMAAALARSMMQNKEMITVNILNKSFS